MTSTAAGRNLLEGAPEAYLVPEEQAFAGGGAGVVQGADGIAL